MTERCEISVLERDMLDVAQEYVQQGCRVAVLNMANAATPGGGFQKGAGAQEEDLHRRTDAFRFLLEQEDSLYPIPEEACQRPEESTERSWLELPKSRRSRA